MPRLTRSGYFSHLRTLALLLFASFAITTAANAQTGLYIEFGGSKVGAPSNDWIYGPTFGVYHDFLSVPLVHLGADLRGSSSVYRRPRL